MPQVYATILGGLPVIADIWFSRGDGYTSDDDAGVDAIYWMKRDGTPGKLIPTSVRDRAEAYDYAFCGLIVRASEQLAAEAVEAAEAAEQHTDTILFNLK